MPEVIFTVELPDGTTKRCYSPSTIVKEYFAKGDEMPVAEFVSRSGKALNEASERVRTKFGFSCSSASSQLEEIKHFSKAYPAEGIVRILSI